MLFSISEELFAGQQIPFTPWRNDFNSWLKCVIAQLKSNLIIAFARSTMRNRIGLDLTRNLNLPLGNQGASNRGAQ